MSRITDPLCRRFYYYALAGFVLLSIGYLLRERLDSLAPMAALLLGVFPNLLGSFATPLLFVVFLANRFPGLNLVKHLGRFALINLFVWAVAVLIEILHVVFKLGIWDTNDVLASLIGGLASILLFHLTGQKFKSSQKTNGPALPIASQ